MPKEEVTIEAYLMKRLSKKDQKAFEEKMADNQSLREAVAEEKELIKALETLGDHKLKERINRNTRSFIEQPTAAKRIPLRGRWRWMVAASITLLIAAALWYLNRPASTQQLYTAYYETYTISAANRADQQNNLATQALSIFDQGNYSKAFSEFETLYQKEGDIKWKLAQGICQMELHQFQQAIETLNPLLTTQDGLYAEQAYWYTALAQLQLNHPEKSITSLEQLLQTQGNFKQEEATELLQKLR